MDIPNLPRPFPAVLLLLQPSFPSTSTPLNFSLMATEDKTEEAFISQPLTPTAMVLDLGCTRAMASRVAAQDLMKFCDDNPNCGIWYTIAETTSQFTFANSESDEVPAEVGHLHVRPRVRSSVD